MRQQYSEEFKKAAIQKVLTRGNRSVKSIRDELGIANSAIYKWQQEYAMSGNMKKSERSPQNWKAIEKLNAVITYEGLPEAERGEFLRREGLHSDQIVMWKKNMEAGLESAKKMTMQEISARAKDRKKIRELESDLNRKDRALAETAALLVLKKKADLLWGSGENE